MPLVGRPCAGTSATSKRGHDHRRAAEPDLQEQLAVAAGDVEQRHRDEVARRRARRRGRRRCTRIAVSTLDRKFSWRGHRALGEAGRAARVEDRGEVARARGRRRRRGVAVGQRVARARSTTSAPESSTTYSTSGSAKRVLTGTTTAPASWVPKNASTQSTPVGQPDRDAVARCDARRRAARRRPGPRGPTAAGRSAARRRPRRAPRRPGARRRRRGAARRGTSGRSV